ncbi:MAG: beta-propeller domain-containing protein [Egibacteraceae bacterium]
MRNAKVLAAAYVGVLVVSAVAVGLSRPSQPTDLRDVELAASLQAFEACDDALAYFTEAAAAQEPAWRAGDGEQLLDQATADDGAAREAAQAPAPAAGAADTAGSAFSGTNVQEAGVDEPDLVKTDGRRIVTVAGGSLHVLDATAQPPVRVASLELPGDWSQELLMDDDRALVFSQAWSTGPTADDPAGAVSRSMPAGAPQSVLTLVDLTDAAAPQVVSTLTLDGEYVSARMVDGVARVVLRSHPSGPVLEQPVPLPGPAPEPVPMPQPDDAPPPDVPLPAPGPAGSAGGGAPGAGTTTAPDSGEATIDDWVPHYTLEGEDGATEDRLVPCEAIHRPTEFAGVGMVSVVAVDLAGDLTPGPAASVVADAQTVYASTDTLYVAFTAWETAEATEIHAFDIADPAAAVYTASGSVPGRLLSQWALSEHAGHLRVATTESGTGARPVDDMMVDPAAPGPEVESIAPAPPPPSQSAVTVLATQGDTLAQVGRVEGLGPDERIYAVRFMGDVGYVVTFRETDPLYTLDLSDPADPRVLGELKILGYSAYLHPLGDGLLLGVGQDATEQGQVRGTQLSLFDVRDLANPTRIHQTTLEGGSSAVEHDHRAFLSWEGTIVLPLEIYPQHDRPAVDGSDVFTGAVGFTADRAAGFREVGRVSHTGHLADPWMGAIRRSLVVGDTLYTVSEAGVGAADLATFTERAWIPLP